MNITDIIITVGAVIGAVGVIFGGIVAVVIWFQSPKKNADEIKALKEEHETDMELVNSELCVMDYAILAALDALRQQGYKGEVETAHEKLEKHLNQKAHGKN